MQLKKESKVSELLGESELQKVWLKIMLNRKQESLNREQKRLSSRVQGFNNLIRAHLWLPTLILKHVYKERFSFILS
jgi:hypothetical protein